MKKLFFVVQLFCWLSVGLICETFAVQPLRQDPNSFTLITVLYNETNEARMQEYITCLEKNLHHALIGQVIVLYDVDKDDNENKLLNYLKQKSVKLHYIHGHPTFGYCFDYANQECPNSHVILSNADIYFNDTLFMLKNYNLDNKCLALTRWDVQEDGGLELFHQYSLDGKFNATGSYLSQDVWIFRTPMRQLARSYFRLGTWACDSYIAYELYKAGLQMSNPCLSIQCCHLHITKLRRWIAQSIPGAIGLPLPWCYLE